LLLELIEEELPLVICFELEFSSLTGTLFLFNSFVAFSFLVSFSLLDGVVDLYNEVSIIVFGSGKDILNAGMRLISECGCFI
jgi:hypothetical protein